MNDREIAEFKINAYRQLFFYAQLWFIMQIVLFMVNIYVTLDKVGN